MLEVYKFVCMTSPCEIQLYCENKEISDLCAKDILKECKRLEDKYNYYNDNSYLSNINNRDTNILDSETKTLLQRAKQYYKKTNFNFDITVVTLKNNDDLLPYVGCEHFNIKKNKIYFDNIYTKIDLGGFVKEYSVNRAVSIIKKYKIKSALVNFGGDIFALGLKPNNEKFKISITNPLKKNEVLFDIDISNQALTTSALYERKNHIISKNKISDILSATVVSNCCIESGVYSTSYICDDTLINNNDKYLINKNLEVLR